MCFFPTLYKNSRGGHNLAFYFPIVCNKTVQHLVLYLIMKVLAILILIITHFSATKGRGDIIAKFVFFFFFFSVFPVSRKVPKTGVVFAAAAGG